MSTAIESRKNYGAYLIVLLNVIVWTTYSLVTSVSAKSTSISFFYFNLSVECLKLVFCLCRCPQTPFEGAPSENRVTALHMLIPATLYVVNNYLTMFNYSLMDPATYKLLINIKILCTGLLLPRRLSSKQWFSLILLCFGCCVATASLVVISYGALFGVLVQALVSSAASVYLMVKLRDSKDIWTSNMWMYSWGVVLNLLCIYCTEKTIPRFTALNGVMILLGSFGGIFVSLLLNKLGSVAKEMVNAMTILTVSLAQWLILGVVPHYSFFISAVVIIGAIRMYQK